MDPHLLSLCQLRSCSLPRLIVPRQLIRPIAEKVPVLAQLLRRAALRHVDTRALRVFDRRRSSGSRRFRRYSSSNALPYAADTRVGGMPVAMRVSVDGQRLGSGARRFHLIYLGPTRTALRTCRVAMGCLSGDSRLRRTTSCLRDDLNSLAQNRGRDGRGAGCMRSVGSQASWK